MMMTFYLRFLFLLQIELSIASSHRRTKWRRWDLSFHSIADHGMAQKSSIRYQVCNSSTDEDTSPFLTNQINPSTFPSIAEDDLHEITITSPNHLQRSLLKLNEPSQSKYSHGSNLSISSIVKPHRTSISLHPRQSIFGTLATTLTAVRKSSTTALALAQQRLSTDNGNLFSGYQGNWKKHLSSCMCFITID